MRRKGVLVIGRFNRWRRKLRRQREFREIMGVLLQEWELNARK